MAAVWRMIYLNLDELLRLASRTLGEYKVRDYGLLNAGLARPKPMGSATTPIRRYRRRRLRCRAR
jgi:hypothetical protein